MAKRDLLPEAVQNFQIVSGAMSRAQAAFVFKQVVKMVKLKPELSGSTMRRHQRNHTLFGKA